MVGLVATGAVAPYLQGVGGALALHALSAALLAAGVAAVAKRRRQVVVALVLGIPAVALSVLDVVTDGSSFAAPRHVLQTVFFGYTALIILADVLRQDRVTAEKIRGAVCVYLLIGGTWAFGYLTVLRLDPGAIAFSGAKIPAADVGAPHWVGDVLYFSFITLTSTGYGDVVPVSPLARWMAQLEAIVGQLYLAILIARLVGLHIAHAEPAE
jgi:hypothetical protein